MYIYHLQTLFLNLTEKDQKHETHKESNIRPNYELHWPANHHCAGITLRVQVHTELALRVINVTIVRQHKKIASDP